jgi:GalNAc-alpha-(1->4)-GalNAc-alpha-(1->3)-diNAcBac-PP-undecaprenol alpha-1,4-N-acetyl-D-galactosaminyltransferase
MRLTLVISSLGRGGAERAVSILASAWAEEGKHVTLLTFDHGEPPAYALHPEVKVNSLGLHAVSTHSLEAFCRNLSRIRRLRQAIRESDPDLVISFMDRTNVLTLLAIRALPVSTIVAEQTDPALYDVGRVWSFLRRLVYRLADGLVCPTPRSVARFRSITGLDGVAIPNPIDVPTGFAHGSQRADRSPGYVLIGMGRLVPQKGFDLLLNAFSRVTDGHPDWTLTLLGAGPLLADLQAQAESLNLSRRIQFLGPVSDPYAKLRAADMFVFSSRFEGFGMALAEAMACGLPVVSFDCPEGPADIIRDGVDGVLIPPGDVPALADALDRLMGDPAERRRLAARAPEVLSRFGRDRIMALWQDLFDGLLPNQRDTDGTIDTRMVSRG